MTKRDHLEARRHYFLFNLLAVNISSAFKIASLKSVFPERMFDIQLTTKNMDHCITKKRASKALSTFYIFLIMIFFISYY